MDANRAIGARAGRTRAVAIASILAVVIGLLPGVRADAALFNAETFDLANGMKVVVVPHPGQEAVTHMVWYRVGAIDEPKGLSGIAHFLEHLMFKATNERPAGDFSRLIARSGGRENAFTSSDYTAYFQTVAKDQLPMMMELEAERMTKVVFDPGEVASERQVILEERHQRVDNNPEALLGEQHDAVQFLNHPYRNPVIGWEHEIKAIQTDDLRRFYERWYAPNNAILVVAGDVTVADIKPLAERFYGAISRADVPVHAEHGEPPPIAARRLVVDDPRVRQPVWQRSYLAPSYRYGDTRHAYALQVLAQLLGGGPTSRLHRRLVMDEVIAVSASADYDPTRRGPAVLTVYAKPRSEIGLSRIEASIDEEIANIVAGEVTSDEVERATRRLRADAVYARDSLFAGALIVGQTVAVGLPIDHVERWPEAIAAVSVDEVIEAARVVLSAPRSVTALLPDHDAADRAIQ